MDCTRSSSEIEILVRNLPPSLTKIGNGVKVVTLANRVHI